MSVPSYKRSVAKAVFVHKIFQLNVRIGEIVNNSPKKYKQSYGDMLIQTALKAFGEALSANEIFTHSKVPIEERTKRIEHLSNARSLCNKVAAIFLIYAELMRKSDSLSNEKAYRWEEDIGTRCVEINTILSGMIKKEKI